MNFGDKLKQLRTQRNLTQPQFAEAIGIEQSYLSKLENDKSQPSADMFSSIIKSLQLAPADFLADIDRQVLHTSLRHIPEVSQFLNGEVQRRLHDARKYIWGAAAAGLLGFALMLAANDGIFYANNLYKYKSQGVLLEGESDQTFEQAPDASRVKVQTIEVWGNRGSMYFAPAANGQRKFELADVTYVRPPQNKIMGYVGALLMFGGLLLLVVEWRMRKATGGQHAAA
ncbi:helix-turn-helix domain-containing protein [Duganella sp. sic0402]|uniref:helix-turn-helix domain-containing protein n=1 Tax=Duganella sp. sic0402 TaxID=2854786 RepID=UPI001C4381B6|nr:helix-turn-helix domain-containing protein [Duganella sp. sic0402]MBV7536250.1 helix-turn-helix domain-containing protein [Duganella sp. sic0402]